MSENKIYLQNLANRVVMYNDAKQQAVKFLVNKGVKNKEKIQNALIMSQLWMAKELNETITYKDLLILLGGEDDNIDLDYEIEQTITGTLEQVLEESIK